MADEGVLLGDLDCSQCLEGAEILFTLQRVISTARADKLPLCILFKKKCISKPEANQENKTRLVVLQKSHGHEQNKLFSSLS